LLRPPAGICDTLLAHRELETSMASYTLHIQYVDRPAETRTFTQAKVTIGRDAGDIVLHDSQVSGRHGEITFDGSTLKFTDVGSTNGSFLLQGQRVANIELTPGIALRLGNSLITVQVIDAPNAAGKGRTVIAGPGMAPGFPAPMRPPGPPAPAAAPGVARPPGAPAPAAPPGGFAFAPTAQMQSPAVPQPGVPRPGGLAPQPAPPQPIHPFPQPAPPQPIGTPPQPIAAVPQPAAPAPFAAPPQPIAPQPVAPPVAAVPMAVPSAPEALVPEPADGGALAPLPGDDGPTDLVSKVRAALLDGWATVQPVFAMAAIMAAAVFVPIAAVQGLAIIALPATLAGILSLLLSLATLAGVVVLMPSMYRYVLGARVGQPIDPKAAIQETVAKLPDRAVHCFIPMIPLGIFAGPIYFVEHKKLGDVVSRNFNLWGKDWVTPIVAIFAFGLAIGIVRGIIVYILALLPLGVLLALVAGAVIQSLMIAYWVGLSVSLYLGFRRRFEGVDAEAEARAALALTSGAQG
jgi:hypothetical protein